jgi:hypothetical protein
VVLEVCDLGKASLIIGYTWLCKHNPDIDWETGEVQMTHCPKECNVYLKWMKRRRRLKREKENGKKYSIMMEEVPDEEMPNGERLRHDMGDPQVFFSATHTCACEHHPCMGMGMVFLWVFMGTCSSSQVLTSISI